MPLYRPVILLGNGIRGNQELIDYLCSLNIPILTTWPALDLIEETHTAFCGRPGILGQRAANIIQQKATHLYCFGARLDTEQVFYDYDAFAPSAKVYIYDIDPAEFKKFPKDVRYCSMGIEHAFLIEPSSYEWITWCKSLQDRFYPELNGKQEGKFVDPFYFMKLLSNAGKPDDVFAVGSSGNAATIFMQTFKVKKGQRVHNVSGIGAMGADIPMALGSALASGKRTICVTGDGGFQLNVQELEVIRRLHLPITFFVINNGGYASIRANQDLRYGRRVGSDMASGSTFPKLEEIAAAYGLQYKALHADDTGTELQPKYMAGWPQIVEVFVDPDWIQYPRCMASVKDGVFIRDDMSDMTPKIKDLKELMDL